MAARSNHEDRVYTVTEPLELQAGVTLPVGVYSGRLSWTEYAQPSGPPRIMSKRFVLPLSADQVKAFGGKLTRSQKSLEVDVSKLVAQGQITT